MLMHPTESPGLDFTHAKALRFLSRYSCFPSHREGSLWLCMVFPPRSSWEGAMKWVLPVLLAGEGSPSGGFLVPFISCWPTLTVKRSFVFWFKGFFFFYSKNTVGISSAWIAIFIKNDQFQSAVGLGWHLLPAHHSYCQQKGANQLKQKLSTVL